MLTDEDKDRIFQKEIYRQEVLAKIGSRERQQQSRVWQFLNSAFGIWLLATVVVGGLSWSYTRWDAKRAATAAYRANITRLDIEIASRLQGAYDALTRDSERIDSFSFHHLVQGSQFHVYNEYSSRNTRSLMIELSYMVPERESHQLQAAVQALAHLSDLAPASAFESGENPRSGALAEGLHIVTNQLALPRWRLVRDAGH